MVKPRMTALDVRATVEEMRGKLIGLRLLNLYDLNAKMFLLRFGHGENKKAVLLENGIRFHLTEFSREKPKVPSQFTLKLRKHIRSWRLESISQLQHDRTIDMCFGAAGTVSCFHIIIELFAKGNIVLTDHEYTIMMLLRTHKDDDVKIAVRQTYPISPSNNDNTNNNANANENGVILYDCVVPSDTHVLEMRCVSDHLDPEVVRQERERRTQILKQEWTTTFQRNSEDETLRSTVSGVRHFGPAIAEHIITLSKLNHLTHTKKKDFMHSSEELFNLLLPQMIAAWDMSRVQLPPGGYLVKGSLAGGAGARRKKKKDDQNVQQEDGGSAPGVEDNTGAERMNAASAPLKVLHGTANGSAPVGAEAGAATASASPAGGGVLPSVTTVPDAVQYDDFSPVILAQYNTSTITEARYLPSFGDVCDAFFLPTEADKIEQHNDKKKNTALSKREKFERDHLRRISALEQQQALNVKFGETLIANADRVDEALNLINGALATGIQWNALKAVLKRRHEEGHPVAYIIHDLFLERNAISVLLEQELYDDEDDQDVPPLVVEVSLSKTAHANAADYFAKKKANKIKLEKTLAATEKAAAGAARKGERQAAKQKTKKQLVVERKRGWWEKFNWFRTSAGDVVLQGKDQQTTEILIRRVRRLGDVYVHCDVPGALPCLLRPMGATWETMGDADPSAGLPVLKYQSLAEAGGWCVSRSGAWQSKQTTSAWWVYASQITGGSAAGSFLYDGDRHFIPPQPLSLGFGLLFAVDRDIRSMAGGDDNGEGAAEHAVSGVGCPAALLAAELPGLYEDADGSSSQAVSSHRGRDEMTLEGAHEDIVPDPATALPVLPTIEALRAEQRKNIAPTTRPPAQAQGKGKAPASLSTAGQQQHTDPHGVEEKKKQILQGNLTKQQARKLQKIRRKYGDQDDEDRQLGAMLNGNSGSLVQELLKISKEKEAAPSNGGQLSKSSSANNRTRQTTTHSSQDSSNDKDDESGEEGARERNVDDEHEKSEAADGVEAQASNADTTGPTTRQRSSVPPPTESPEVAAKTMADELSQALPYYTCRPLPTDTIRHVVGFCAPYAMLLRSYPLRVELIVGTAKKGQVASAVVSHFTRVVQKDTTLPQDSILAQFEKMEPNDIIEQLRSDIKPRI